MYLGSTQVQELVMDRDRLIELESKIAHQEMAIEKLLSSVHALDTEFQKLELSLKIFKDRVKSESVGEGEIGPANEKPPHY